jgi:hypothetical protein
VGSSESQFEQINILNPIWDAAGKQKAVIVTLMPRYIAGSCCGNTEHATRRDDPNLKSGLVQSLEVLRKNLKDFLFNTGRRSFTTMDPWKEIRVLQDNEIWGEDPVHPMPAAYGRIADGVVGLTQKLTDKLVARTEDNKRRRTDTLDADSLGRRGRGDYHRGGRGGMRGHYDHNRASRGSSNGFGPGRRGYSHRGGSNF